MEAYDRFTEGEAATLSFEDGRYLVTCSFTLGSWQWVVWHKGAPVAGRRDWHMDAAQACAEALAYIQFSRESAAASTLADDDGPEAVRYPRTAGRDLVAEAVHDIDDETH